MRLRLVLAAVHVRGGVPDGAAAVAARVGVEPVVVDGWLCGTGDPMGSEQAARVAAEYGVPASFLLDDHDDDNIAEQLRLLIVLRDRR